MEKMVFGDIPSYNWEYIEKKGKKLAKYGVEVKLIDVYTKEGKVTSDYNPYEKTREVEYKEECISIEITFPETLEQGNWEFLGLKVAFEDTFLTFGNVPDAYKNDSFRCDHCHSDRYRKSVVIIKNMENGEIKQVGKSCLDKYLNSALKQFSSLLLTIDELIENALAKDENGFFEGFSLYSNYVDVKKYLWCAYSDIMERGYHKRNSYEVQEDGVECTSSSVYSTYNKMQADITPEQEKVVNECIEAYKAFIAKKGSSDFSDNVIKLLSANFIENKYSNMIVFVPTFLINSRKFEAEKKAKQEQAKKFNDSLNNEFLGEIKEKVSVKVRLIHHRVFENCWDGYHITYTNNYTFMDEQGHLIQWKTTKNLFDDTEKVIADKTELNLQGIVKAHNEFKDRYYTILTRCKIA